MAEKRQITLAFEKEAELKEKQGQPILISLMLRNLIDNAIKYCPEGAKISVKMTSCQIIVEDNGGGVEPDDLKKLGQRFYRLQANEKAAARAFDCNAHCRIARIESALRKCDGKRGKNRITSDNFSLKIR